MENPKLNKALKIIYLIVGILIIGLVSSSLINKIPWSEDRDHEGFEEEDIYTSEKLQSSLEKGSTPQGVLMNVPEQIGYTSNLILPVSVMTYEEEREFTRMASSANNISSIYASQMSLIFLDKDYNVLRQIPNRKCYIQSYNLPQRTTRDSLITFITYQFAFEDSNGDSLINEEDRADYYISNLDGTDLQPIMEDVDIRYTRRLKDNIRLYIEYTIPDNQRKEHRRQKIAIYNTETRTIKKLTGLEEEVLKVEKLLLEQ